MKPGYRTIVLAIALLAAVNLALSSRTEAPPGTSGPELLAAVIRAAERGELFTEQFRFARVEGVYPPEPED